MKQMELSVCKRTKRTKWTKWTIWTKWTCPSLVPDLSATHPRPAVDQGLHQEAQGYCHICSSLSCQGDVWELPNALWNWADWVPVMVVQSIQSVVHTGHPTLHVVIKEGGGVAEGIYLQWAAAAWADSQWKMEWEAGKSEKVMTRPGTASLTTH